MPENTYNTEVPETDAFGKPTKEAYEEAKESKERMSRFISLSRKLQNELIDKLCAERETEKMYLDIYERSRDVIYPTHTLN